MKIVGWCALHDKLVDNTKHRVKCSKTRKKKLCRWFEHKVPDWQKPKRAKLEARPDFNGVPYAAYDD